MPMQARDYYLSNLGVTQYVPSDFCVVEEEVVEHAIVTDVQQVFAAPEVKAPVKPSVVLDNSDAVLAETVVQTNTTITTKVEVKTEQTVDTELRFRISYWQLPELLVFSALDYGENPPQDQHQLLSNILKALGRLPGILVEPELVDWPVVPTAPAGTEAAKAMFTSLLKGRAEQTGSRWVLVMGQRAGEFLLDEIANDKEHGKVNISDHCCAVVTPGLDEMLADPQSKRTTWQLIRFLSEKSLEV